VWVEATGRNDCPPPYAPTFLRACELYPCPCTLRCGLSGRGAHSGLAQADHILIAHEPLPDAAAGRGVEGRAAAAAAAEAAAEPGRRRARPVLIDFERCSGPAHPKPKNVTQFLQFFATPTVQALLRRKAVRARYSMVVCALCRAGQRAREGGEVLSYGRGETLVVVTASGPGRGVPSDWRTHAAGWRRRCRWGWTCLA
jgi:hypothetical protein